VGGAHGVAVSCRELSEAIRAAQRAGRVPVIADIKPVSPRDGNLLGGRSPGELAAALEEAGACALSVVTAAEHFGGSCQTLREVTAATSLPVLRKDFLRDSEQLVESRDCGARAILMILSTMSQEVAAQLYDTAQELGLEPLVESHTAEELERALSLTPSLVGINNRDILQLETDPGTVATTESLAPRVPDGIVTISESALLTDDDVRRALAAGADAVLVGTMLLRAPDPAERLRELVKLKRVAL
jgi:indole-3-glycerol phosphate synthase